MADGTADPDAPAPPALEYAPQPSVGGMTLTRTAAGTTVVVRPTRREYLRAAAGGFVLAGFLIPTLIAVMAPFPAARRPPVVAAVATLVVAVGAAAVVPAVVVLRHGTTWEAAPTGLTLTGRQWNGLYRQPVPAADVADVRVERIRLAGQLRRPRVLLLVGPDGRRATLARGTAAELAFLSAALVAGLGLGPDPMRTTAYPSDPSRWGRVARSITPAGVVLVVRPPVVGWAGAGVIAVAAAVAAAALLIWGDWEGRTPSHGLTGLALAGLRAGLVFALTAGLGLLGLYRVRRRTTISVVAGSVTVNEQSPVRPGLAQWSADQIAAEPLVVRPRGRRADLLLSRADGTTAPLLSRQRATLVRTVSESLAVALELDRQRRSNPTGVAASAAIGGR